MSTFQNHQIDAAYPTDIKFHYWTIARTLILKKILSELEQQPLLDFGCGNGDFVNEMINGGREAFGIEPATFTSKAGTPIYKSLSCFSEAVDPKKIKIVTLLDVIEHIEDPVGLLNKLKTFLPSLNYVVITVPARMELWSNYDVHYGHLVRYDFKKIQEFAKHLPGYRLVSCSYLFRFLYIPAYLLTKIKSRKVEIVPPKTNLAKLLHKFVALLLYFESRLLDKRIPGTSLLVVLKKIQ